MKALLLPALLLGGLTGAAHAEAPLESQAKATGAPGAALVQPGAAPAGGGFTPILLSQTRAIGSNVITTNPFIDGQVVGQLGGSNGTTVLDPSGMDLDGDGADDSDLRGARFVEQRLTGFFTWAPTVFDGRVALASAFEIDFLWGDQSYATGGNTGGGIGADQVNLQTRRVNVRLSPRVGQRHELDIVTGMQFVGDSVYDPAVARPDDLFRAGGGLRFWGTEAAGVAAYGTVSDASGPRLRYRAGTFSLVENGVAQRDDAALHVADVQYQPDHRSRVGGHAWLLRDYAEGRGGVLGTGLTSALSEMQGGPHFVVPAEADGSPAEVETDVLWLSADAGFNHALDAGPLGANAVAAYNLGRLYATTRDAVALRGWMVDGGLRFRWAPGAGSVIAANGTVASRDGTGINAYTGLVTGNSYGIVGATWGSHGMMLLFQDPWAINRSAPLVFDVSNGGSGLTAITATAGWDAVPNRVTLQAGFGHAVDGDGKTIGTEFNGRLVTHPWFGTNLGVAVATVQGTSYAAAPAQALLHCEVLFF